MNDRIEKTLIKTIEHYVSENHSRRTFEYGAIAASVAFAGSAVWGLASLINNSDRFTGLLACLVAMSAYLVTWELARKVFVEHFNYARNILHIRKHIRAIEWRRSQQPLLVEQACRRYPEAFFATELTKAEIERLKAKSVTVSVRELFGFAYVKPAGQGIQYSIRTIWLAYLVTFSVCGAIMLKYCFSEIELHWGYCPCKLLACIVAITVVSRSRDKNCTYAFWAGSLFFVVAGLLILIS